MQHGRLISDVLEVTDEFKELYGEVTEKQKLRYSDLIKWFKSAYKVENGYMASSSGRVEILGNHTDHNGGKVLACSISLDTLAMFLPNNDGIIRIKSEGYDDIIVDTNNDINCKLGTSTALVKGVVEGFKNEGLRVGGFNACITSNVVSGAGISSSASFEVLICEILNFLYNDESVDATTKSIISRYSENVYFGKPCGLLDQSAIAFGGVNMLDFAKQGTLTVTPVQNSLEDYTLVLIDTGGNHSNLTAEYASITDEMRAVSKALGVNRLIETSEDKFYFNLPELYKKVNGRAIMRAIHFFEENKRVESAYDALNKNDYDTFLTNVKNSGISSMTLLQNCYVPADKVQEIPTALAVTAKYLNGGVNRVHGGGFAGTILNIVKNENVAAFVNETSRIYGNKKVIPLKVRSVGTKVL